jgi:transposase
MRTWAPRGQTPVPQFHFNTRLLRRPLLVIRDGLPGHRSRDVRDFVRAQGDRVTLEVLPGYAPELNPVEHIWSYLNEHERPNLCPRELWHRFLPQ